MMCAVLLLLSLQVYATSVCKLWCSLAAVCVFVNPSDVSFKRQHHSLVSAVEKHHAVRPTCNSNMRSLCALSSEKQRAQFVRLVV